MTWTMRQFYEDVTNRFIAAFEKNPHLQYYTQPIARQDDPWIWADGRGFHRKRAHLTIWNEGWTNKRAMKRAIKESVKRQVAAIDAERKK